MNTNQLLSAVGLLVSGLVVPVATAHVAAAQPVGSGTLQVLVTRSGVPVPGATVCVGITADLNQFFQGTTDALGIARVNGVPPSPFVVTANLQSDGARVTFSPVSNLSFFMAQVALPAPTPLKGMAKRPIADPSCPTTAAGPARALLPPDIQFQPTPIPRTGLVTLSKSEFCFGALGAGCGEPQTGIPATALCFNGVCGINGGSWDHDQCCFQFPFGMACQLGPLDAVTGNDGHCVTAWNKAVRLASKGVFWTRPVNFAQANSTGRVEFALYCAPVNSLVSPEDAGKCCSGSARALTAAEVSVTATLFESLRRCQ